MEVSLRELAWDELAAAELIPDADDYARARRASIERGRRELPILAPVVRGAAWRRANALLPRPVAPADLERIVGLGFVLTEFTVAPLGLPTDARERVAAIGALSSFVVAIYDGFLDSGAAGPEIVPPGLLRGHVRWRDRLPRPRGAAATVMARAVGAYWSRLDALSSGEPAAEVLADLKRAIAAMYEAENATLGAGGRAPGRDALVRKAALPRVVMGLPGWLARDSVDRPLYDWHRSWLFALGEYLGAVDDLVDLDDDSRQGQPNTLAVALRSRSPAELARDIAARGERVMAEWHARVDALALPVEVRMALPTATRSWFGGVRTVSKIQ